MCFGPFVRNVSAINGILSASPRLSHFSSLLLLLLIVWQDLSDAVFITFFAVCIGVFIMIWNVWLSLVVLYWVVWRFLAKLFLRKFHPHNRKTRAYHCSRQLLIGCYGSRNLSIRGTMKETDLVGWLVCWLVFWAQLSPKDLGLKTNFKSENKLQFISLLFWLQVIKPQNTFYYNNIPRKYFM